jgi:hypothetical protein
LENVVIWLDEIQHQWNILSHHFIRIAAQHYTRCVDNVVAMLFPNVLSTQWNDVFPNIHATLDHYVLSWFFNNVFVIFHQNTPSMMKENVSKFHFANSYWMLKANIFFEYLQYISSRHLCNIKQYVLQTCFIMFSQYILRTHHGLIKHLSQSKN